METYYYDYMVIMCYYYFLGSHTRSRICVIIYYIKNDLTVSMHKMLPISTSFISHICLRLYFLFLPISNFSI